MADEVLVVADLESICRFCLQSDGVLSDIINGDDNQLCLQINSLTNIEIVPGECLPLKICHRCRYKIEMCWEFREQMLQAHRALQENISEDERRFLEGADNTDSNNAGTTEGMKDHSIFDTADYEMEDKVIKTQPRNERNRETKSLLKINQYPSIQKASKLNQCLLCLQTCSGSSELKIHVDQHVSGTSLEPYYSMNQRDVTCRHCGEHFEFRFQVLIHQREFLGLRPFACQHLGCGAEFYSNQMLRAHVIQHAEKMFTCAICNQSFKRKSDLKTHLVVHEQPAQPLQCKECGVMLKNRLTLAAHQRKHATLPSYKCEVCGKEYFSPSELERHSLSHAASKLFRCSSCPAAYSARSSLSRHEAVHRSGQHKCQLCGEQAASREAVKEHMKRHVPSEYPYRCIPCDKGFLLPASFKKHSESCGSTLTETISIQDSSLLYIPDDGSAIQYLTG